MSGLVARTPGSDSVTNMMASIFDFCISTHCMRCASGLGSINLERQVVSGVLLHPVAVFFLIYQAHRFPLNLLMRGLKTYFASPKP